MDYYLVAGFGQPLGEELQDIKNLGFAGIRQGLHVADSSGWRRSILKELVQAKMKAIIDINSENALYAPIDVKDFLLENIILADRVGLNPIWHIGNEPNLNGLSPYEYAKQIKACLEVTQNLMPSGVSGLDDEALAWFTEFVQHLGSSRNNLLMGIHPYRTDRIIINHDNLRKFRRMVDRFAVDEIGWHTAKQWGWMNKPLCFIPKRFNFSEEDVRKFALRDRKFWRESGAEFYTWYQLNDGPQSIPEDRFGIRRHDKSLKPVAKIWTS